MNHTELLNHLVKKHGLKSYLEIGVKSPDHNFSKINVENKWGVDPNPDEYAKKMDNILLYTSDEYFDNIDEKFDLIFIDGLHHSDQVQRDFENSLKCLNDKGLIVIHDCLPVDEITTSVPRGQQKIWHGDVYKFCMKLNTYKGIDFITYSFDHGCCVIWKDEKKKSSKGINSNDWNTFKQFGRQLLNVQDEINI